MKTAAGRAAGYFKNVKAMLMHKLGNVVVNNTDNLLDLQFCRIGQCRNLLQLFPDHRFNPSGS